MASAHKGAAEHLTRSRQWKFGELALPMPGTTKAIPGFKLPS
jgi:hypothetical protein